MKRFDIASQVRCAMQADVKKENLSYEAIADAVAAATEAVAGSGEGIKDSPLSLKVYGPHLHDLTLIDLPGIIVAPLPGESIITVMHIAIDMLVAVCCHLQQRKRYPCKSVGLDTFRGQPPNIRQISEDMISNYIKGTYEMLRFADTCAHIEADGRLLESSAVRLC